MVASPEGHRSIAHIMCAPVAAAHDMKSAKIEKMMRETIVVVVCTTLLFWQAQSVIRPFIAGCLFMASLISCALNQVQWCQLAKLKILVKFSNHSSDQVESNNWHRFNDSLFPTLRSAISTPTIQPLQFYNWSKMALHARFGHTA